MAGQETHQNIEPVQVDPAAVERLHDLAHGRLAVSLRRLLSGPQVAQLLDARGPARVGAEDDLGKQALHLFVWPQCSRFLCA